TSLSRSGLAWSVCVPFGVSVDSITYFGISALLPSRPDLSGTAPGSLVEVEQRRADEQHRREHEVGTGRRRALGDLAAAAEQQREHQPDHVEDDHQRRETAERVDVVGAPELDGAPERLPEPGPLDERCRNRPT